MLSDSGESRDASGSRDESRDGTRGCGGAPPHFGDARGARGAHGAGHAAPVHRVGNPHRPDYPLLAARHLAVRPRARAALRAVARTAEFRPDLDCGLVGRVAIRVVRSALAATWPPDDDDPDID